MADFNIINSNAHYPQFFGNGQRVADEYPLACRPVCQLPLVRHTINFAPPKNAVPNCLNNKVFDALILLLLQLFSRSAAIMILRSLVFKLFMTLGSFVSVFGPLCFNSLIIYRPCGIVVESGAVVHLLSLSLISLQLPVIRAL